MIKFSNNFSTTLVGNINDTTTSITVDDATGFPDVSDAADYGYVTIAQASADLVTEIVKVTSVSGNILTVVRGQDDTPAAAWLSGAVVQMRYSKAAITDHTFPIPDEDFNLTDVADPTKKLQFGAGNITTGTTRTLEAPDADGTIALDPMTTRGDIIVRDASNAINRLGLGSSGSILASDGNDVVWENNRGAGESTGVLTGGIMSTGAGSNQYSISDGTGQIVDSDGTITTVSWSGKSNIVPTNIATQLISFVGINAAGNVVEQSTRFTNTQSRTIIVIGVAVHVNLVDVDAVNNEQHVSYNIGNQLTDLHEAMGFFNISGNVFSANGANLNINKSIGVMNAYGANYPNDSDNPSALTLPAVTLASFQYRFSDGSNGVTGTTFDPANLDDGAGGLTPLSSNKKWGVSRVYVFTSNNIKIQRGVQEFDSKDKALAGISSEAYITEPSIAANGLLRGWIAHKQDCTNLSNSGQAVFIEAPKFQGSTGGIGSAASTLQDVYNNSANPEIITDVDNGALTVRRGSAADTDAIFEGQNNAGSVTFSASGNGLITSDTLTASRALASDASKNIISSATTSTELGHVSGVTSNIQTQINSKEASLPLTTRGDVLVRNASNVTARLGVGTADQVLTSDGTDVSWQDPVSGLTDLTDTPANYTGAAGYSVVVNQAETGVEFVSRQPLLTANLVLSVDYSGGGDYTNLQEAFDYQSQFAPGEFTVTIDITNVASLTDGNDLQLSVVGGYWPHVTINIVQDATNPDGTNCQLYPTTGVTNIPSNIFLFTGSVAPVISGRINMQSQVLGFLKCISGTTANCRFLWALYGSSGTNFTNSVGCNAIGSSSIEATGSNFSGAYFGYKANNFSSINAQNGIAESKAKGALATNLSAILGINMDFVNGFESGVGVPAIVKIGSYVDNEVTGGSTIAAKGQTNNGGDEYSTPVNAVTGAGIIYV